MANSIVDMWNAIGHIQPGAPGGGTPGDFRSLVELLHRIQSQGMGQAAPTGFNFPINQPAQAPATPFADMLSPIGPPPAITFPQGQGASPPQMSPFDLTGLPQGMSNAIPAYLKGGVW